MRYLPFGKLDENDPNFYPFDVAEGHRRTPDKYPYSYDAYFLFGSRADMSKKGVKQGWSDRLEQQDREKYNRLRKQYLADNWGNSSKEQIDKFLSAYFDTQVSVVALAQECNRSNGYPYWIFWFKEI